jgi:hypothetical protein
MIEERAGHHMSIYWQTLVRYHPDRDRLNRLWAPVPTPMQQWLLEQGEIA